MQESGRLLCGEPDDGGVSGTQGLVSIPVLSAEQIVLKKLYKITAIHLIFPLCAEFGTLKEGLCSSPNIE